MGVRLWCSGSLTGRRNSEVNRGRRSERAGGCSGVKDFGDVQRSKVEDGF